MRLAVGLHEDVDATVCVHPHPLKGPVISGGRGDRGGPRELSSGVDPDHERPVVVVVGNWYLHGQVAQAHGPLADRAGRNLSCHSQLPFALVVAHPGGAVVADAGRGRDVPARTAGTIDVGVLRPPGAAVSVEGEEVSSLPAREVVICAGQVKYAVGPHSGHVRVPGTVNGQCSRRPVARVYGDHPCPRPVGPPLGYVVVSVAYAHTQPVCCPRRGCLVDAIVVQVPARVVLVQRVSPAIVG